MMNILIVSNNDACRSRMAMEILTSFGRGMKVFTAGVLPGNGIPDTVFSVMGQMIPILFHHTENSIRNTISRQHSCRKDFHSSYFSPNSLLNTFLIHYNLY